jgi:hypothetical protein
MTRWLMARLRSWLVRGRESSSEQASLKGHPSMIFYKELDGFA